MKYLMITSLFVSIIDANIFHQSHFFLLLTAGGISLYWLLSHFLTLHKEEIKILKKSTNISWILSKHSQPYHTRSLPL